jgi:hypothetical protein
MKGNEMIEVEYKNQTFEANRSYPWIGITPSTDDKGLVVLFTAYGKGFILRSPAAGNIGVFASTWNMNDFVALKEPITLKNV